MKKEIIRREFLKLKIKGLSYSVCQKRIKDEFEEEFSILTLKRWWKRFKEMLKGLKGLLLMKTLTATSGKF